MLFSVLIANYNNSRFLAEAIESVRAQTYTLWEIILVDDGSTDDFEKTIEPYRKCDNISIYKNNTNRGCGYTKRRCASLANGDLMGFLDPDDTLHPEALAIMSIQHQSLPDFSIVHSNHFICDVHLQHPHPASYPRSLPAGVPYLLLNDGSVHAFASFKTRAYRNTAGINGANLKAVDQDLYYKLEETGPVHFVNQPLYYYRIHPQSISTSGKEWEATIWHYRIIREACLRRMRQLQKKGNHSMQIAAYRTHFYKVSIFLFFRTKSWYRLGFMLACYPFVGGARHIVKYLKKLPVEGFSILKKSFVYDHQIKPAVPDKP